MNSVERPLKVGKYSFKQHLHNYSVWTAARAVQRGFTTTRNIKIAIEKSDLQQFCELNFCKDVAEFEGFHRKCANQIMETFDDLDVRNATYGRASKIIAIYLKTAIVIPSKGECILSEFIHPPIDNILLSNLKKDNILSNYEPWTTLSESKYWELCKRIKGSVTNFNWTLEEYWRPELG